MTRVNYSSCLTHSVAFKAGVLCVERERESIGCSMVKQAMIPEQTQPITLQHQQIPDGQTDTVELNRHTLVSYQHFFTIKHQLAFSGCHIFHVLNMIKKHNYMKFKKNFKN